MLKDIIERLEKATKLAGRAPHEVTLLAVAKGRTMQQVEAMAEAGVRHFGENRVQEADAKYAGLREVYRDIKLHLIGPLQTNKARDALAIFDVIESVDRPELVDALVKGSPLESQRFYVQVNIGEEPQKAGVSPAGLPDLLAYCEKAGLPISGLMCIPPVSQPPAPHFALLAQLAKRHQLSVLSMGMSDDFEVAVMQGSTEVRLGRALFGAPVAAPAALDGSSAPTGPTKAE